MGGIISHNRNNEGVEQLEYGENNAYRYPPKCGSYFGSHFFMGGERFEAVQPEAFLFGDNMDLNFLGSRPHPFPYHVTVGSEPSKALRGYVNVRKDTLKFVKIQDEVDESDSEKTKYTLEFIVDTDLPCSISIHMFAREEMVGGVLSYSTADRSFSSAVYQFPAGYKQVFRKDDFCISPSDFKDDEWSYKAGSEILPLVIHCYIEKEHLPVSEYVGDGSGSHGQVTLLSLDRSGESSLYSLRYLKQKQIIDGLPYLLQEIYGLEEWTQSLKDGACEDGDVSDDDSTTDCVVCMSEVRDTLILPCRHMCLCSTCAESLRYQASACPICRAPFRALLQVRGLRRTIPISAGRSPAVTSPAVHQQQMIGFDRQCNETSDGETDREVDADDEEGPSQTPSTPSRDMPFDGRACCSPLPSKPAPSGYEAVPLMELLSSGWMMSFPPPRPNPFTMSPDGESAHLDQLLGRSQAFIRRSRSGITSSEGVSLRGSASLLRSNSSRRSMDGEQCNLSIESGSLRSRSSKKKGNKKRIRPNPLTVVTSPDSTKAVIAAALLSPRNIDLSVAGATGVSPLPGDCEVIELTPSTIPQLNEEEPPVEPLKVNLPPLKVNIPESVDGFHSVELRAPGVAGSTALDMVDSLDGGVQEESRLEICQTPVGVSQSEEDSSLSSTTSGRALLSPKSKG